ALRKDLGARLAVGGTTLVIAGAQGSGRSVLARSLLAERAELGAYIDLGHTGGRPGSLAQRIARAFGAVARPASGSDAEIEGPLDVLAGSASAQVPLIVIDRLTLGTRAATDMAVLARAARSTRYFNLLVIGPSELAAELARADVASALVSV